MRPACELAVDDEGRGRGCDAARGKAMQVWSLSIIFFLSIPCMLLPLLLLPFFILEEGRQGFIHLGYSSVVALFLE